MSDITYRGGSSGWVSVPVSPNTPLPVTGTGGGDGSLFDVNIEEVGGVAVDNDEPAATTPAPFTAPTTSQVAMSTTIAQIVAADGTRRRLFVCCSAAMFIGPSGITASTGLLLPANVMFEVPTPPAALYGITASGTPSVTVMVVKD